MVASQAVLMLFLKSGPEFVLISSSSLDDEWTKMFGLNSSLNPWEKQILKKKLFKLRFPLLLPSKLKDLHLVYLPLKQFKWLPQTGLIYKSRLHSMCL